MVKDQLAFLQNTLTLLIEARSEYEELISEDPSQYSDYRRNHARIVGKAISAILSIDDDELREIGINRLTPNMVTERDNPEEVKRLGNYDSRNRNALSDAVIRIGQLISIKMN